LVSGQPEIKSRSRSHHWQEFPKFQA